MKQWLGPIFLFVVAPILGVMLIWNGHCEDKVIFDVISPDGEHLVQSKETVCKSDAPTATQIFMSEKEGGNWVKETVILLYKGEAKKSPVWEGNKQLALFVPKDGEVLKHYPSFFGVKMVRK